MRIDDTTNDRTRADPLGTSCEEASDAMLLRAWACGDSAAGSSLVRRHFPAVFRFFRTKVDRGVEDLAQRTFLACVESRDRFRGDGSFRSFVLGIARMQLLRHLQRERPRAVEPFSSRRLALQQTRVFTSPTGTLAEREEHRLLLMALRRLPLDLQMLLELHYWEGLSVADLARVLEIPAGTVKTRLFRARRMLRALVGSLDA
jgi:RNA polymerase sigma factor (sigma-70 family)